MKLVEAGVCVWWGGGGGGDGNFKDILRGLKKG